MCNIAPVVNHNMEYIEKFKRVKLLLRSILTTHMQKENPPAAEWLGSHRCGSRGLADPGAELGSHCLRPQRCAEETAPPRVGPLPGQSTPPPSSPHSPVFVPTTRHFLLLYNYPH